MSNLIRNANIAYVIDPRFPGGTSSAIARELTAVSDLGRIEVHAVSSKMFKGAKVAPQLKEVLKTLGLQLIWDAPSISADIVLVHNPSFLKFNTEWKTRIVARQLIVVTHENFLRPGGAEAFDVKRCLELIDRASLTLSKSIAPISPYNRTTVLNWISENPLPANWGIQALDWFNICDFEMTSPTKSPRDRRGRHSRAGMEKFPGLAEMDRCFPNNATNVILGADLLLAEGVQRPHWNMYPFQGLDVARYFELIDFMVYFTAATWRESFGRVLAEGVAAGKVVISDPGTASVFQGGVVAAKPEEVDGIISEFIANPESYARQVQQAQAVLAGYSSSNFQKRFLSVVDQHIGVAA